MSPREPDYEPHGMPQPTLAHWHTLLTTAAGSDESYARVPVESLLDLLKYAATSSDVLYDAGLDDVATSETEADVRGIGRHLRVVRPGEAPDGPEGAA